MKWESYSHPISDIRDWDNNNRLELKPDFQRNEVWSRAAQIKCYCFFAGLSSSFVVCVCAAKEVRKWHG